MNSIKKYLSSAVFLTTFLLTTSAFAMKREREDYASSPALANNWALEQVAVQHTSHAMDSGFPDISTDVDNFIVRRAAYEQCLDDKTPVTLKKTLGNLALVCTTWQEIIEDEMKVKRPSWKAWYGVTPENEHIYQQFLNGTLIYRPDPVSNEGMITLKISDLINPLEGTFDLSQCGDTGKYLNISTGYRKGMGLEKKDRLEIWLAPRFMIEKKLKSSASHFQWLIEKWKEETAPIGIFWTKGDWDDLSWYDFLTTKNIDNISSENLFVLHTAASAPHPTDTMARNWPFGMLRTISCSFVNQNKNY